MVRSIRRLIGIGLELFERQEHLLAADAGESGVPCDVRRAHGHGQDDRGAAAALEGLRPRVEASERSHVRYSML